MSDDERRAAPSERTGRGPLHRLDRLDRSDRAEAERPSGSAAEPDESTGPTEAESTESTGKGRRSARRKGCGCLFRLPLYLLVLVALAGAGLWFWGQSPSAHDAARRMLAARLSEYFGRDVRVGAVRWTIAPLSVELEDLVIPGPPTGEGPGQEPEERAEKAPGTGRRSNPPERSRTRSRSSRS